MKILLCVMFLLPAFAQDETPPGAEPAPVDRDHPPANAVGQSRDRSVLQPKPGSEAIKPKDYSDQTGYWHPFARMGRYVLSDQKVIWTSPFHTSRKDAQWWLIFGGATGALIATDKYVSKNAPSAPWIGHLGDDVRTSARRIRCCRSRPASILPARSITGIIFAKRDCFRLKRWRTSPSWNWH